MTVKTFLKKAKALTVLSLKPGDVILIEMADKIPDQRWTAFSEEWNKVAPGTKVMMLAAGASVTGVLRTEGLKSAAMIRKQNAKWTKEEP